ncbi:MAG: NusG domain II-containing protein [Paraclostridium sp.]|uniref:NusG domain II-containing protein n=1 Tax=Paraclostridium sp. TaxID=2023273 RepID=UPI003F2F00B0
MKKNDFFLILSIIVVVCAFLVFNHFKESGKADKVVIYVDNKVYKEVPLDKNEELTIKTENGYNKVKIHDKGVEVTQASCPDEVCVKTGFINKSNKSIVCIPNKVSIKIISDEKNDIDIISN